VAAVFFERALADVAAGDAGGVDWQAHDSAISALEQSSAYATELTPATHERTTTTVFLSRSDRMDIYSSNNRG